MSVPNIPSGVRWGVFEGIGSEDDDGEEAKIREVMRKDTLEAL